MTSVSGHDSDGDAGTNFAVSRDKFHLSGLDQRIVVVADVADAIALVLLLRVLPFAALHVVLRSRESCHSLAVLEDGVPTRMIEMQVRVDDDIDFVESDLRLFEGRKQPRLVLVNVL